MSFIVYRAVTGRTGIAKMSDILRDQNNLPKLFIVNELLSAGILNQRDDGVLVCHHALEAMMPFDSGSTTNLERKKDNVVKLSEHGRGNIINLGVA
jgi:hypothetical protein